MYPAKLPRPGGASCIKGRQGRQPSLPDTRPNFPGPPPIKFPYKIRIAISAQASASAKA